MTSTPAGMKPAVRRPLLTRTLLEVLRDADGPVRAAAALEAVSNQVRYNEYEAEPVGHGTRASTYLSWFTTRASGAGWISKDRGHWTLTDLGRHALMDTRPDADLDAVVTPLYRASRRIDAEQSERQDRLSLIRRALELMPDGTWTSFKDLGELLGTNGGNAGAYLWNNAVPNAYRVLDVSGRQVTGDLPDAANYEQLENQVQALQAEGVEFVDGRASQAQRLSADELRALLTQAGEPMAAPSRRAWLVRGSNVNGMNLVPTWLVKGSCSVAAAQLRRIDLPLGRREIAAIVEEDYAHVSYNARNEKTAEFDAFLNRMQVGDLVISTSGPEIYLGTVTGDAHYVKSPDDRSNLRRAATWHNAEAGIDFGELPTALKARISSQHTLVDLTTELASLERLIPSVKSETPAPDLVGEALLQNATHELADQLLVDRAWLDEVIALLRDRRQIIFYGPPGTGKTYLAQAIAEHASSPESVKLVQFHPAYSYEDFFEGFRPTVGEDGAVGFTLSPGPFRRIVDAARENPGTPYVLIVDEINRANLAKVFGELYFLLEYRDRSIDLLYSSGDEATFTLPRNVFIIGTMNTADRSIALVDAAMRRRFAFVPLHPAEPPTSGMLRRWLQREALPLANAEVLDSLNSIIADDDFKIGPSYFMRSDVYADGGLERLWRTAILPLLEEHHYGDGTEVKREYSLKRLLNATQGVVSAPAPELE